MKIEIEIPEDSEVVIKIGDQTLGESVLRWLELMNKHVSYYDLGCPSDPLIPYDKGESG